MTAHPGRTSRAPAVAGRRAGGPLLAAMALWMAVTHAGAETHALARPAERLRSPAISLIIDDMGNRRSEDLRVVELPAPVACAFLPHTPFAASVARLAFQLDKEVILHLPLESESGAPLGPGGLTASMSRGAFRLSLEQSLEALPHLDGVSNHMGSLMTASPEPMGWIMQDLRGRGRLFFVDSRTTERSVAESAASRAGIPTTARDVFLDNDRDTRAIEARLDELVERARLHGTALGIGHPRPETLDVLERRLPGLAARGIRVVPVRALIELRRRHGAPPPAPPPVAARYEAAH